MPTLNTQIDWTKPIQGRGGRTARWLGTLQGNKEPFVVAFETNPGSGIESVLIVDNYGCVDMGDGKPQWMIANGGS